MKELNTKSRLYSILLLISVFCLSCDDECTPRNIDDTDAQVSITGRVVNVYDLQSVKNVRLRILDLLGGTAVLKSDTSYISNEEGCFRIEFDRDLEAVDMHIETSPQLSYDLIHQRLSAWDESYLQLYNQVEDMRIQSFMRWSYDPATLVEVVVAPRAEINIDVTGPLTNDLSFGWNFTNPSLSEIGPRFFSIARPMVWPIPAEGEIIITVIDDANDQQVIWDTTFTPRWGSLNNISIER